MSRRVLRLCGLLATAISLQACISTNGGFEPNTQFVYPNANVKMLGPASAEATKYGILLFVRSFSADDILKLYDQALKSQQGANVMANFDQDTTVYNFILFNKVTYTLRGQAASMEVGKQVLR